MLENTELGPVNGFCADCVHCVRRTRPDRHGGPREEVQYECENPQYATRVDVVTGVRWSVKIDCRDARLESGPCGHFGHGFSRREEKKP